jgi:hypothetical protein
MKRDSELLTYETTEGWIEHLRIMFLNRLIRNTEARLKENKPEKIYIRKVSDQEYSFTADVINSVFESFKTHTAGEENDSAFLIALQENLTHMVQSEAQDATKQT